MLFAMSTSVFAAEKTTEDFSTPQKSIVCQTNLDEMDLSKSFTLTESYTDNNGTPITITSTLNQLCKLAEVAQQPLVLDLGHQKPLMA